VSNLETPEVTPLTVPTRPVPDGIVASSWGDWVHDRIKGLDPNAIGQFHGSKTLAPGNAGYLDVLAAELGLTSIVGAVASVAQGAITGFYLCTATIPDPGRVRVTGVGVTSAGAGTVPTFAVWGSAGALTLSVLAWGAP
jgi:hypothetical protein